MKTHRHSLALLLLVVAACQVDMVKTDGALRTLSDSEIMPLNGHAHQFALDSSVRLMANLAGSPGLSQLATSYGWGGSFPVSAFRVSSANQGVLLWYCFRGGNNPQLFLALEHLSDYDPANLPSQPISQELVGPTSTFRSTFGSGSDEGRIRDFIQSQSGDGTNWVTFAAEDVNRYIESADSLFNQTRDQNGDRYNNYMFGFFSVRHEAAFDAFLDRAGENGFVRYYFGYDERDRPNRIRIILTVADSRSSFRGSSRTNDGGESMQRSWPPPPDH